MGKKDHHFVVKKDSTKCRFMLAGNMPIVYLHDHLHEYFVKNLREKILSQVQHHSTRVWHCCPLVES